MMSGTRGSATRGNGLVVSLALLPLVLLPDRSLGGEMVFLVPKLIWLAFVVVPVSVLLVSHGGIRFRALAAPTALVAWMATVSLFHDDPWRSLAGRVERYDGVFGHVGLLICAFGGAALAANSRRRTLGASLAFSGLAVAGVSIGQRTGLIPALASQDRSILLVDMPGSLVGNRGYTACFIAAMLPFIIERAALAPRGRALPWTLSVGAAATAIGLGWSRGALLAALAAVTSVVVLSRDTRKRVAALAAVACVGLILGSGLAASTSGGSAAHSFSTSDSGRGVLYRGSLAGVAAEPLVGLGAGGVLHALNDEDPATVLRWAGVDGTGATTGPESTVDRLVIEATGPDGWTIRYENITSKSHNELLDYAVSYGLPAAVLAAATMALALHRARRDAALGAALLGSVVGLLTWPQVMRTAPILWALIGFALSLRPGTNSPVPPLEDAVQHELGDLLDGRQFVAGHIEHLGGEKRLHPLRASLEADDQRHRVAKLRREHDLHQLTLPIEIRDRAEPGADVEQSSEGFVVGAAKGNRVSADQPGMEAVRTATV